MTPYNELLHFLVSPLALRQEGGVFLAVFYHEFVLVNVVEITNGYSDAVAPDEYRSFILLGTVLDQKQAHHERVQSSDASASPCFR